MQRIEVSVIGVLAEHYIGIILYTNDTTCRCNVPMQERKHSDVTDNVSWYCLQCYTRKSIRDGIQIKDNTTKVDAPASLLGSSVPCDRCDAGGRGG